MIENERLKFELLDPQKLITVNKLRQITNPVLFKNEGMPTDDGLLSNDIFGISTGDRGNIFAYIDLNGKFLHPLVYIIWTRMDSKIKHIIHGTKRYILEPSGELTENENGKTGLKFLYTNAKKIKIKHTDSRKRDVNIQFIQNNIDNMFIDKCIVIPAYYRDVNTNDKFVGVGEVNELYNSLLISTNTIKETADYGLNMSDVVHARVQDTLVKIYNWFVDEPNLSKKNGIMRRSVLSKTTDYSSRLVISAPDLDCERPEDMMVDLDHSLIPLASLCVDFYPYIIFHVRTFFSNEFSTQLYPYIEKGSKEVKHVTLKDTDIEFSDDRIKKEIDRFINGFSNRLIPISIPNEENKKIFMKFKGRQTDIDKLDDPGNTPLLNRRLTWCDVFFMAAVKATHDKHVLITRFPLSNHFGQFPTKIRVGSTINTEPMFVDSTSYRFYPRIREEDIGNDTSNKFMDTLQMSNLHLGSIGGDYDGDQVNVKGMYFVESNDELDKHMNSLSHYIGVDGLNVRTTSNESVQAIYNLTKIVGTSKLTDPIFK